MKNKGKILAGILAIGMMTNNIMSLTTVYAADVQTQVTQENSAEEMGENTNLNGTDVEYENKDGQGADTADDALEQQDQAENSWRYQNGEVIQKSQFYRSRAAEYPYAWQKVDGVYMNSAGEVIEGAVKKGIDVSEHQGKIDWEKVKADGIDYAIIRCGFGNNYTSQDDKQWLNNVSECERLGIPYGVYIYSYAKTTAAAKSEAEHVLRLVQGKSLAYPVYFDMEDDSTANLSEKLKGEIAQTFCDTITAAGYRVGIYANLHWWLNHLTSSVFDNSSWSKWVAQYNASCDFPESYDMWQCTSSGTVKGINGYVDVNFWMNGDSGNMNPDSGGNEPDNNPDDKPDSNPDYKPDSNPGTSQTAGATLVVRRGNEYHFKYSLSNGGADLIIRYGYANDEVLVGDWDGDGIDTLCVRRGNTYYFKNSLSSGPADKVVTYGRTGDVVLSGDWNGDGVDTLCVRRDNTYHIKNSLSGGVADKVVTYGRVNDSVLVGDWDANGTDTLCVRRGNTYYFKNSLSNGAADSTIPYGYATDSILVGDWNGNGMDTLCVRRDNEYHFKNSIQSGGADKIILYGRKDDVTYAGKWK